MGTEPGGIQETHKKSLIQKLKYVPRAAIFSAGILSIAGCTDSVTIMPVPSPTQAHTLEIEKPPQSPLVWEFSPISNVVRDANETKIDRDTFILSSEKVLEKVKTLTPEHKERGYYPFYDEYIVALEIPQSLKERYGDEISLLNKLLPEEDKIAGIQLWPGNRNDKVNVEGSPSGWPLNPPKVIVQVRPETPVEISEIERTVFHEGIHRVLANSKDYGRNFGRTDQEAVELWNKLKDSRELLGQAELEKIKKAGLETWEYAAGMAIGRVTLDKDPFNVITERSYVAGAGHPFDNPEEMLVSTITVMHYFPKSFIESVDSLSPQDRASIKGVAKHAVDTLLSVSVSDKAVYDLFSPELLEYLGYISKTQGS